MDYSLLLAVEYNFNQWDQAKWDKQQIMTKGMIQKSSVQEKLKKIQLKNEAQLGDIFKYVVTSESGKYFYHMSIIDYLQEYNDKKKFENFWKVKICRNGKDKISCVPAIPYGDRFYKFMEQEVIVDDAEDIKKRRMSRKNFS